MDIKGWVDTNILNISVDEKEKLVSFIEDKVLEAKTEEWARTMRLDKYEKSDELMKRRDLIKSISNNNI